MHANTKFRAFGALNTLNSGHFCKGFHSVCNSYQTALTRKQQLKWILQSNLWYT